MARNQSNFLKIFGVVGAVLGFLALLVAGAFFLFGKSDRFSALPPFPIDTYLRGGNLWSYDEYKIEGRVDNVIFRSQNKVVASIQPEGSKMRLPVVIQSGLGMKSVQLEQNLVLKVRLGQKQEILCSEYAPSFR